MFNSFELCQSTEFISEVLRGSRVVRKPRSPWPPRRSRAWGGVRCLNGCEGATTGRMERLGAPTSPSAHDRHPALYPLEGGSIQSLDVDALPEERVLRDLHARPIRQKREGLLRHLQETEFCIRRIVNDERRLIESVEKLIGITHRQVGESLLRNRERSPRRCGIIGDRGRPADPQRRSASSPPTSVRSGARKGCR